MIECLIRGSLDFLVTSKDINFQLHMDGANISISINCSLTQSCNTLLKPQ